MMRDYKDGVKDNATFFVGKEVETTPTKGKKTLFVVGLQKTATVQKHAEKNKCKHIYFGANHSYKQLDGSEVHSICNQMKYFLKNGYYVTMDTNPGYKFDDIHDLLTHPKFTLVYAVVMADLKKIKGNVVIKVDDKDFKATNTGVWCWTVKEMADKKHFTGWDQYGGDKTL